jgi:NTP pyrophosphatase (non-canonical NTP hydrolase)
VKYAAYSTENLRKLNKRIRRTINDNRRKISRLIHELDELTEALKVNNQEKKSIKRELKARIKK